MKKYQKLLAYKNAVHLKKVIFKISLKLSRDLNDVVRNMKRCSKDIPEKIAKAYEKDVLPEERINFLLQSLDSNKEMIVHLIFLKSNSYLGSRLVNKLLTAYMTNEKRLNALVNSEKKSLIEDLG